MLGKKVLALTLLISFIVAFTGCGTASPTTGPAAAATNQATQAPTAQATPAPTEVVNAQPLDVYFVDYPRTDASDDQAVLDFINQKFNVDFHFLQPARDTFDEKFSTMLASQQDMDFFIGFYGDRTSVRSIDVLREKDMIITLDDLLASSGPNLLANVDQKYWDMAKYNGKTWFVPNIQFASKVALWYRQDWLNAIGYTTMPATIADFETMLTKLKTDNPGKADNFYPLISENLFYLTYTFANSFTGTYPTYIDTDGSIKPSILHPNFKTYLETLNRWFKNGLINPDEVNMNANTMGDLLTRGQVGVWASWFTNSKQDLITTADPNAVVNFMKVPTGPSGTGGAMAINILSGGGPVIMKHSDPAVQKKIIEMLDWFNTEEGQLFNWYGIKDKHWVMQGDKVAPAPGVDPKKPPYNQKYLVNGGNMYKFFKESTLTVPPITSDMRQAALKGDYPCIFAPDYMLPYDWSTSKSKDYLTDLTTTMVNQLIAKVMTGEADISYYDQWVTEWKAAGGETYLTELNEQYQKLRK